MKAVVRRQTQLVCAEIPEPVPAAGQVLLRTLSCGICGSDLHSLHHLERIVALGKRCGAADTLDPTQDIVFGHEFCGEVLDYGPRTARRLKKGARVVSVPFALGPQGLELIGYSNRFPGGFAERIVATEDLLLEVPADLPADHAALVEPLAVGVHAVARAALTPKSVSLVMGCGPVGLAVIAALKMKGAGPIIASDFSPSRRQRAERLGADIVVDPRVSSPHEQWSALDVPATLAEFGRAQLTGRSIRDAVIFECVGVPGLIQHLFEAGPPAAQIIVVGACMEDDRIIPILAINKQLRLEFVFAYTAGEFSQTLRQVADGAIDAASFITGTVGRSGVAGAFEALREPETHVKIMVEPGKN